MPRTDTDPMSYPTLSPYVVVDPTLCFVFFRSCFSLLTSRCLLLTESEHVSLWHKLHEEDKSTVGQLYCLKNPRRCWSQSCKRSNHSCRRLWKSMQPITPSRQGVTPTPHRRYGSCWMPKLKSSFWESVIFN